MPLTEGALAAAASVLAKFYRRGFGGRGDLSVTSARVADLLGITAAEAKDVIAHARAIAESGHDEAALLELLRERFATARLEYPRAACPCCGAAGQLRITRVRIAAALTA